MAQAVWYARILQQLLIHSFLSYRDPSHHRIGPIIRINPTEVHISDPEFFDVVYSSSAQFDKLKAWRNRFGVPYGVQSTVEHDLHHHRRIALNPYFSKRQINDFAPHIQECAGRLCDRLLREYKCTSVFVNMNDAWATFATDVVTFYTFAWKYDFLNYPAFVAPFTSSTKGLVLLAHFAWHFPCFLKFLQSVPDTILGMINPAMRSVFQFQNVCPQLQRHPQRPSEVLTTLQEIKS